VSIVLGLLILVVHAGLIVVTVPVLAGMLGVLRARLAGRVGPPFLQPMRDIQRLLRKQPVLPESASPLLPIAPLVSLACLAVAALLVPSFALGMATAPVADLVVIAGLLATSRLATSLAALDAGAAISGLAASRAMSLAVLTEPALLLAVFVVATMAGSTNLDSVAGALREGGSALRVSLGLALLATAIVALVEAGRFQGRGSVLGLGQDTAALSLSGWHLAVAEAASALRLVVWLALLLALFVPVGVAAAGAGLLAWIVGLLAWVVKMAALTAGLALIEAGRPALRWSWAPELLGMALLLGLLAAVFLFIGQGLA
jgi:formate hydrogenlyase subunit 4